MPQVKHSSSSPNAYDNLKHSLNQSIAYAHAEGMEWELTIDKNDNGSRRVVLDITNTAPPVADAATDVVTDAPVDGQE